MERLSSVADYDNSKYLHGVISRLLCAMYFNYLMKLQPQLCEAGVIIPFCR